MPASRYRQPHPDPSSPLRSTLSCSSPRPPPASSPYCALPFLPGARVCYSFVCFSLACLLAAFAWFSYLLLLLGALACCSSCWLLLLSVVVCCYCWLLLLAAALTGRCGCCCPATAGPREGGPSAMASRNTPVPRGEGKPGTVASTTAAAVVYDGSGSSHDLVQPSTKLLIVT